ncbi:glycosyltransferase family 92 protein [Octadecabacter sp. G9-8]|uniref:Glycosyltransferase family 92 protein n=1 Tax=Octadecabacter dasysiphoniae TaxID=2909341 RepID=A0ABS9CWJ5_9RHOB|nr:glycosyltransferase family 92 protein [Octadecabacter dasysiphoniae]MCF2871442.1 glycosyltransferase family 92 protein [Octadecabacter dasysiphoniae]
MRLFKFRSQQVEVVKFSVQPSDLVACQAGLAIAVLIKNEAASIDEWLRFHQAAGVSHFILYDDGCTDDSIDIARRALTPSELTVIPWAQRLQDSKFGRAIHNQGLAFAHAISNFRTRFRWIAFTDIDEFLFPTSKSSILEVLSDLEHVDNLILHWTMFGRQNFHKTPSQIIPNYTERMLDPFESQVKGILNFKCVVNPMKVTKTYIHGFETNSSSTIWNSLGSEFKFGDHKSSTFHDGAALQLNHYYSKSQQQLDEKIAKGSIGDSLFTAALKSPDVRATKLTNRVLEIERETVEDLGIQDFCKRANIDLG